MSAALVLLVAKLLLQVFLTLSVLSFLYRDNPVYKFAEHLFVGVAAGYGIVLSFHTIFMPNLWRPFLGRALGLQGYVPEGTTLSAEDRFFAWMLLVPAILGFMMFFKFSRKSGWIARWPMAVVIGAYAGLAVIGFLQGDLVPQIQANLLPIVEPGSWGNFVREPSLPHLYRLLWNPVLILGVIACLVYFFFSTEHRGAIGATATLGIWFLMLSFGASYGNTVMTRISLFLERANFLLIEESRVGTGDHAVVLRHWHFTVGMLVVLAALIGWMTRPRRPA